MLDTRGLAAPEPDRLGDQLAELRSSSDPGLLTTGDADIVAGAQQVLSRAGTELELRVAPWPRVLPLLGAARLSEPHDGRALVADAGHSSIKTGVAVIESGALASLETLGARPAPQHGRGPAAPGVSAVVTIRTWLGIGFTP